VANAGEAACLIFVTDVTMAVHRERYLREQQNARDDALLGNAPFETSNKVLKPAEVGHRDVPPGEYVRLVERDLHERNKPFIMNMRLNSIHQ